MRKFLVTAYTDGACKNNPGIGGWGWWYSSTSSSKDKVTLVFSDYGGDPSTTNNKMELQAMTECITHLPDNSDSVIYTDSNYVLKSLVSQKGDKLTKAGVYSGWMKGWINSGWKKPKKNIPELKLLDKTVRRYLKKGGMLTLEWVKGHSGDPGNDKADALANKGVDMVR